MDALWRNYRQLSQAYWLEYQFDREVLWYRASELRRQVHQLHWMTLHPVDDPITALLQLLLLPLLLPVNSKSHKENTQEQNIAPSR